MLSWALILILAGGAQATLPGYADRDACNSAGVAALHQGLDRADSVIKAQHLETDLPIGTLAVAGLYFGPIDFYCIPGPGTPE